MSPDIKKFKKWIEDWCQSDEGKAFFEQQKVEHEILLQRFKRFEKYLETHDFDELMLRLILEHDDGYRKKCQKKGCEDCPNNKLQFVLDYVVYNTKRLDPTPPEIVSDFSGEAYEFRGYYFQIIYGQGSFIRIFNKEDKKLLLTV
jgi:hypothetical protein